MDGGPRHPNLAELVQLPRDALDRTSPTTFPARSASAREPDAARSSARPTVLLLDEPLGALDPIVRHDLQQDLIVYFRA